MFHPPYPIFDARPLPANGGWNLPIAPSEPIKPEWHADEAKKRAFGTQLGKGRKPLDAALMVFGGQMADGLWVVQNWLRDPIVVETREIVENEINLLDKSQLSAKLLKFAEDVATNESKDRLAAYKLYAEIQGYLKEANSAQQSFVNNHIKLILVEADNKEETKIIEHNEKPETIPLPMNLKLVG